MAGLIFAITRSFLQTANQVRPALKESGAYMRLDQKIYFISKNSLENGYFSIYVMSDVQNVLTSLIFAGILVAVALLIMTAGYCSSPGR